MGMLQQGKISPLRTKSQGLVDITNGTRQQLTTTSATSILHDIDSSLAVAELPEHQAGCVAQPLELQTEHILHHYFYHFSSRSLEIKIAEVSAIHFVVDLTY